jgi:hypothetical protein
MGAVTISTLAFNDANLRSTLQHLSELFAKASEGRIAPPVFVIYPNVDDSKTVTLSLANVPFSEALRYIGDVTGTEFIIDRYAVSVVPKTRP